MPLYLTKSRFKQGLECPTKLFYTNKKEEYTDSRLDDSFLEALAEGGFQVGELAVRRHKISILRIFFIELMSTSSTVLVASSLEHEMLNSIQEKGKIESHLYDE